MMKECWHCGCEEKYFEINPVFDGKPVEVVEYRGLV
jgi:hypothetical protein